MTISVGDHLPETTLYLAGPGGPEPKSTAELFGGRKVVLVGMPGAFTPTCHQTHLPGFVENRAAILAKGVDAILVLATNDAFVLNAWAEASGAKEGITFVSDSNADFVRKTGLDMDGTARGLGIRAKRFAMIVDDGAVASLAVEDAPGKAEKSAATEILAQL